MFILTTGDVPRVKLVNDANLGLKLETLHKSNIIDKETLTIYDCLLDVYYSKTGQPNSIFWYRSGTIVYIKSKGEFTNQEIQTFTRMFEKVAGKKPIP